MGVVGRQRAFGFHTRLPPWANGTTDDRSPSRSAATRMHHVLPTSWFTRACVRRHRQHRLVRTVASKERVLRDPSAQARCKPACGLACAWALHSSITYVRGPHGPLQLHGRTFSVDLQRATEASASPHCAAATCVAPAMIAHKPPCAEVATRPMMIVGLRVMGLHLEVGHTVLRQDGGVHSFGPCATPRSSTVRTR